MCERSWEAQLELQILKMIFRSVRAPRAVIFTIIELFHMAKNAWMIVVIQNGHYL